MGKIRRFNFLIYLFRVDLKIRLRNELFSLEGRLGLN